MSAFKKAITYYFAIVSLFSAVFLALIGLLLLYDSDSLELHGNKAEKVKPSFICAGVSRGEVHRSSGVAVWQFGSSAAGQLGSSAVRLN
ncbi:hypothetical protein PCYB_092630 [Plasmodium cynomolgi strain B]|uniref:Uncharacterized protein n=1 Tax=Plasmodium cynomolgi (strain B) TaxID=1120755 RepID=K6VBA7_PLACD|nr:hypothetical protein PCYB_092630 [Plasmodium cynomolgi strain B]GAB66477.1 hypothetical protein PCYB_092630 [Plasmodium cynomolgi strain B]